MHFPVCLALLLVCSTLLEAVPSPQIKSAQKQRWRPKAVREKEAAEAAAAAKAAEEAARAAEEAAKTSTTEVTTQVVEDITEIVQEAITVTKEITDEVTVSDDTTISSIVTDEPIDTNAIVVTTTQKNIIADSESSEVATATPDVNGNESIKLRERKEVSMLEEKAAQATSSADVQVVNFCRLSLRGKSCTCHFEKTCRCNCGRIFSANNQHSSTKSVNSNRGKTSRIRIQRFQFPISNKH